MAPGPNDYNINAAGELDPGLGRDEPKDSDRAAMSARSAAAEKKLREELAADAAKLDERDKAILDREQAVVAKERELEARERELSKVRIASAGTDEDDEADEDDDQKF